MSTMVQNHAVTGGAFAVHEPPGFFSWVATVVHTHRGRLIGYARRRGLDAEDALDAVQDGFISFLRLPEARGIAHLEEDALELLTVMPMSACSCTALATTCGTVTSTRPRRPRNDFAHAT